MKIIEMLADYIEEEIGDADKYARKALEYKADYPEMARMFYTLSNEEMEHANKLHNSAVILIEDYRDNHGEPPAEMMAVYEYLHKKQIDRMAAVKLLQSMFKN